MEFPYLGYSPPKCNAMAHKHSTHANIYITHAYINKINSHTSCYSIYHNNIKLAHMGQGTIRQFILELPIKSHLACYSLMEITQHHIIQANIPWTVQITLGISSVGPNLLEPKPRPFWPQQIPIHYITLKQKVKQVGEKPLPSRSLSKLPKSGTHA